MGESSVLQRIVDYEFDEPVRSFAYACAADGRYPKSNTMYLTNNVFICASRWL
jgi:hypothetical protein